MKKLFSTLFMLAFLMTGCAGLSKPVQKDYSRMAEETAGKKFKDYDEKGTPAGTDVVLISADGAGTYYEYLSSMAGVIFQAYAANLTTYAGITPSANVQALLAAADYAAMRTALGLAIGSDVQAYDTDLDIFGGITPSADAQAMLLLTYAQISAALHLDDVITLTGVLEEAVHLGTFTGSTITDNQTIKAAMQLLETALELRLLASQIGTPYDTEAEFDALFALYGKLATLNEWTESQELANDKCWQFGNDKDVQICYDSADAVLELRTSADVPIFKFDLANKTIWMSPTTSPEIILNDSDNPGTDKYSFSWGAQYTDGGDGNENNDLFGYINDNGSKTTIIKWDEDDDAWDFQSYDITTTGTVKGGTVTSNYTIVTPQSKTYTEDDGSETIGTDITSSVLLVTGDNDSADETVHLQDGTIAGQILTVIAVALVDDTDDAFIFDVETDSTCSGCPTSGIFTLETIGSSVTIYWTGSAWIYIGSVVGE
jgi:hypothetical protein